MFDASFMSLPMIVHCLMDIGEQRPGGGHKIASFTLVLNDSERRLMAWLNCARLFYLDLN